MPNKNTPRRNVVKRQQRKNWKTKKNNVGKSNKTIPLHKYIMLLIINHPPTVGININHHSNNHNMVTVVLWVYPLLVLVVTTVGNHNNPHPQHHHCPINSTHMVDHLHHNKEVGRTNIITHLLAKGGIKQC